MVAAIAGGQEKRSWLHGVHEAGWLCCWGAAAHCSRSALQANRAPRAAGILCVLEVRR